MGHYIYRVEWEDPSGPECGGQQYGENLAEARRFIAFAEPRGMAIRLFRKETVGDDDGVLAMSNPSAYDWKQIPI